MENHWVSFSICSRWCAHVLFGILLPVSPASRSGSHPRACLAVRGFFTLDYICSSIGSAVAGIALAHQSLIGESLRWVVITRWQLRGQNTPVAQLHVLRRETLVGRHVRWKICSKTREAPYLSNTLRHHSYRRKSFFWHKIGSTLQVILANKRPLRQEQSIWSAINANRQILFYFTFQIIWNNSCFQHMHFMLIHFKFICIALSSIHIVSMQLYRKCFFQCYSLGSILWTFVFAME